MITKKVIFILLFLNFNFAFSSVNDLIRDIEKSLGVQIIVDSTVVDAWELVEYKIIADTVALQKYLEILKFEFEKYPKNYLNNIHVKKIVLGKEMKFEGVERAAIPDPYTSTLFYDILSMDIKNYLINVLHHELHHYTEYHIWGDMGYDWGKWRRKNKRKFSYGTGGITAYSEENKEVDWTITDNPVPGFLNSYATLGQEEDRSEIVAFIMNDFDRLLLMKFCEDDRKLKRKVKLMLRTLDKVSGTKENYWRDKVSF